MLTIQRALAGQRRCRVRFSDRTDGDANSPDFLAAERGRWTLPRQTHSAEVIEVAGPADGNATEGDALVTASDGAVLVIRTADCIPVAIYGREGIAAVHAGWKGLEAGVVEAAVDQLRSYGDVPLRAIVGPHISACAYEFGLDDLDRLAGLWGDEVRGVTSAGLPALDLAAALDAVLHRCAVTVDHEVRRCTSLDQRYFSHRARREPQRMAMLVETTDWSAR